MSIENMSGSTTQSKEETGKMQRNDLPSSPASSSKTSSNDQKSSSSESSSSESSSALLQRSDSVDLSIPSIPAHPSELKRIQDQYLQQQAEQQRREAEWAREAAEDRTNALMAQNEQAQNRRKRDRAGEQEKSDRKQKGPRQFCLHDSDCACVPLRF